MRADNTRSFEWEDTELYRSLCQWLPEMRTRSQKVLDIKELAVKIKLTREGVYKWLRAGRILSLAGADRLFKLINTPTNLAALERAGRTPPKKQEILDFLLS